MSAPENIDRDASTQGDLRFDAILYPHRSLGPNGFVILMVAVAIVSFAIGVVFMMLGAWPVLGFFGLDVLLIYGAFKLSYRDGREHEIVQLSEAELLVSHVSPSGVERRWRLSPYWVNVSLGGDEPGAQILLTSHGRTLGLGAFLTADEKHDFISALESALSSLRAERHETPLPTAAH